MPKPRTAGRSGLTTDVVEWLKKKGSDYQTRIHAILRSYRNAQSDESADTRT
jgi:uncharacterized protein (DUF4415 family)